MYLLLELKPDGYWSFGADADTDQGVFKNPNINILANNP